MDWKKIREELSRLSEAVDGWDGQETVGALERDWALEKLRTLYELIRFDRGVEPVPAEPEEPEQETSVAGDPVELDLSGMLALETEVEPLEHATSRPVETLEVPVAQQSAHASAPTPARPQRVERPAPESVSESTSEPPAPVPEPEPEPEPIPKPEPTPNPELSASEPRLSNPAPAPQFEELEPEQPTAATTQMRRPERPARPEVERLAVSEVEPAVETTLFDADPEPEEDDVTRHRRKQRVIRSLYEVDASAAGTAPQTGVRPEASKDVQERSGMFEEITVETVVCDDPAAISGAGYGKAETNVVPSGSVLGEVIHPHLQTLADTIEPPRDVASELRRKGPVSDLRQAIGINDKFALIRELFGGDSDAYDEVMQTLNRFDNLDDCVIYLTENFAWNPNSESVQLLMTLLERKFA